MEHPLICLTLTGKTLQEDLEILDKYKSYIDIAELRVDFLQEEERLLTRRFPLMTNLPCILTIRRKIDGGRFDEGEANRAILFARALAFAKEEQTKNFAYVDFEEDFRVSSLQEAALAYGQKIIRSVHDMENPILNIRNRLSSLQTMSNEIPKIAFMPHSLDDVRVLFEEAEKLPDTNHILVAMGKFGIPSRILSAKLKSCITYTSPAEMNENLAKLEHLTPDILTQTYHFNDINTNTKVYGITGWPLEATSSPELHNKGFEKHHINAVYVPIRAKEFSQAFSFASSANVLGMSVTVPHKEEALKMMDEVDPTAQKIGACNTIVRLDNGKWKGYNTDALGFEQSLKELIGNKSLLHKKVAIIGAGGAARAIAYTVKKLKGNACIFNRTIHKARQLAEQYGFKYASLSRDAIDMLKKYNDVIIQTTSKGMNCSGTSTEENDPLYFYEFNGKELLYDIIYVPSVTPIMQRASSAGCKVYNGYSMLMYQGYEQFKLFTGKDYVLSGEY